MKRFLLKFLVLAAVLIVFSVIILWFTNERVAPIPPVTEVEVLTGDSFERDEKLQAQADDLLSFFEKMPSVPIYVKDEIINKDGTNIERGVAYTSCDKPEFPTIFVKKIFYQTANQKQLVNILKHELTHAWLCRQNEMSGHDERFRQKFKEVGGFGN
jgi:SprT-like family